MNRLVIIGNGFDLAHGLPTSYKHFIDDYWVSIKSKFDMYSNNSKYEDEFVKIDYKFDSTITVFYDVVPQIKKIKSYNDFRDFIAKYSKESSLGNYNNESVITFKNNFFKNVCEMHSIQNWVDVENKYYSQLKRIVHSEFRIYKHEGAIKEKKRRVENLNKEFEDVRNLFEKYLCEKVIKSYEIDFSMLKNKDWIGFYNYLKPISVFNNEQNVLKEFLIKEDNSDIKNLFLREKREEVVNKIYFLNFNYTPILNTYSKKLNEDDRIECDINFIHGELENNNENKINFGFGDEMDDDYKAIENINDNEYLKYFKSFQYLQNSNYSNLLSYLDSDKFQVLIMGHSCGLSDRTLLNTIFEHNYCRSIKVFYHQWKDKNTDEIKDNYTEITQNISRHFNKKKLMREKIVNKTLCQPLPQIQLPKK